MYFKVKSTMGLQTNPRLSKASPFNLGLSSNRDAAAHTLTLLKTSRVKAGGLATGTGGLRKARVTGTTQGTAGAASPHSAGLCGAETQAASAGGV